MLAALDVDYRDPGAVAAAVLFRDWTSPAPASEHLARIAQVAPYEPGRFYLRELPCLLAVLEKLPEKPEIVLVDGYVWLGPERPGLGRHLFDALGNVPVVGVAKTPFAGAEAVSVLRGTSRRPLHVTAIGLDPDVAAAHVRAMHGPHRLPTLLGRVDRLCREG